MPFEVQSWNLIDVLLAFALALAVLGGLSRGLFREILNLAVVLAALFVAGRVYQQVASLASHYLPDPNTANLLGFLVSFVLASIVLGGIRDMITQGYIVGPAEGLGRLAGGALGAVSGIISTVGLLVAILTYPVGGLDAQVRDSSLALTLIDRASIVFQVLPKEFDKQKHPTPGRPAWLVLDPALRYQSPSIIPEATSYEPEDSGDILHPHLTVLHYGERVSFEKGHSIHRT